VRLAVHENTPGLPFAAAAPPFDTADDTVDVATLAQVPYVNLFRVVVEFPMAKMPTVQLPAADPPTVAAEAAAAVAMAQHAHLMLARALPEQALAHPRANMPFVELLAAPPHPLPLVAAVNATAAQVA
jgi:hypothetical protein